MRAQGSDVQTTDSKEVPSSFPQKSTMQHRRYFSLIPTPKDLSQPEHQGQGDLMSGKRDDTPPVAPSRREDVDSTFTPPPSHVRAASWSQVGTSPPARSKSDHLSKYKAPPVSRFLRKTFSLSMAQQSQISGEGVAKENDFQPRIPLRRDSPIVPRKSLDSVDSDSVSTPEPLKKANRVPVVKSDCASSLSQKQVLIETDAAVKLLSTKKTLMLPVSAQRRTSAAHSLTSSTASMTSSGSLDDTITEPKCNKEGQSAKVGFRIMRKSVGKGDSAAIKTRSPRTRAVVLSSDISGEKEPEATTRDTSKSPGKRTVRVSTADWQKHVAIHRKRHSQVAKAC